MSKLNRGGVRANTSDFVNDGRGGGASWLSNWKDKGQAIVCIHPSTGYWKRVIHPVTRIVEKEIDGKSKFAYQYNPQVCWEDYENWQLFRRGLARPKDCPHCRFVQLVNDRIKNGSLDLDSTVIEMCDEAGTYRHIKARDLSTNKDHKRRDSFKSDISAKVEWIFGVVDCENLQAGVQITNESQGLGSAVQDVIRKEQRQWGEEDGDPCIKPFAMEWAYDSGQNVAPKDRYKAQRWSRQEITPEIQKVLDSPSKEAICEESVSVKPDDLMNSYAWYQEHLRIEIDLDELFCNVKEYMNLEESDEYDEPAVLSNAREQEVKVAKAPPKKSPIKEGVPCPYANCGLTIPKDCVSCPHCGGALEACGYDGCGNPVAEVDMTKQFKGFNGCIHCGGRFDGEWQQDGCQYTSGDKSPSGWQQEVPKKAPPKKAPGKKAPSAPSKGTPKNGQLCDSCNEVVVFKDSICPNCGASNDVPF